MMRSKGCRWKSSEWPHSLGEHAIEGHDVRIVGADELGVEISSGEYCSALSDNRFVELINVGDSCTHRQIARSYGRIAYLIDGPDEIDPRWFRGDETVLITAGASAPEGVVRQCVEYLRGQFDAEVEEQSVRREHARFPLPAEIRQGEYQATATE